MDTPSLSVRRRRSLMEHLSHFLTRRSSTPIDHPKAAPVLHHRHRNSTSIHEIRNESICSTMAKPDQPCSYDPEYYLFPRFDHQLDYTSGQSQGHDSVSRQPIVFSKDAYRPSLSSSASSRYPINVDPQTTLEVIKISDEEEMETKSSPRNTTVRAHDHPYHVCATTPISRPFRGFRRVQNADDVSTCTSTSGSSTATENDHTPTKGRDTMPLTTSNGSRTITNVMPRLRCGGDDDDERLPHALWWLAGGRGEPITFEAWRKLRPKKRMGGFLGLVLHGRRAGLAYDDDDDVEDGKGGNKDADPAPGSEGVASGVLGNSKDGAVDGGGVASDTNKGEDKDVVPPDSSSKSTTRDDGEPPADSEKTDGVADKKSGGDENDDGKQDEAAGPSDA